ncbi:hypothetical protein HUJ04_004015 [Dendroctonus ponderosae]|nr:hypothetical protein HUJ04_004015 [Dendroctonus ponderosae]
MADLFGRPVNKVHVQDNSSQTVSIADQEPYQTCCKSDERKSALRVSDEMRKVKERRQSIHDQRRGLFGDVERSSSLDNFESASHRRLEISTSCTCKGIALKLRSNPGQIGARHLSFSLGDEWGFGELLYAPNRGLPVLDRASLTVFWRLRCGGGVEKGPGVVMGCFSTWRALITKASRFKYLQRISCRFPALRRNFTHLLSSSLI